MTAEVLDFPGETTLDFPAAKIIGDASQAEMTEVVVIGIDKNGEFWFSASKASGAEVLWLLEIAKKRLLAIMDENPNGFPLDRPPGAS